MNHKNCHVLGAWCPWGARLFSFCHAIQKAVARKKECSWTLPILKDWKITLKAKWFQFETEGSLTSLSLSKQGSIPLVLPSWIRRWCPLRLLHFQFHPPSTPLLFPPVNLLSYLPPRASSTPHPFLAAVCQCFAKIGGSWFFQWILQPLYCLWSEIILASAISNLHKSVTYEVEHKLRNSFVEPNFQSLWSVAYTQGRK